MLAQRWAKETYGNRISAACVACILAPLGKPTRMPFEVMIFSVHGFLAPRKWLVQPESAIARVWGAVTRELKVRLLITISL